MVISSHFPSIPPGFKFRPKKEEVLNFYLLPAINGEPLPYPILTECNIYGERDKEPWKLFDHRKAGSFWVYTPLNKMTKLKNGRIAGSGYWNGRNSTEIRDSDGKLLGYDRYFTYRIKNSPTDGNWVMHEYSLHGPDFKGFAICEITRKDSDKKEAAQNKKRKNLFKEDEEEEVVQGPVPKSTMTIFSRPAPKNIQTQTIENTQISTNPMTNVNYVKDVSSYNSSYDEEDMYLHSLLNSHGLGVLYSNDLYELLDC